MSEKRKQLRVSYNGEPLATAADRALHAARGGVAAVSPGGDSMTAVEAGLDELVEVTSNDGWADAIVYSMAFRHIARSPKCRGWTTFTAGRVFCGCCEWALSGRMDDAGSVRSARFALAALATIGSAIAWTTEEPHG